MKEIVINGEQEMAYMSSDCNQSIGQGLGHLTKVTFASTSFRSVLECWLKRLLVGYIVNEQLIDPQGYWYRIGTGRKCALHQVYIDGCRGIESDTLPGGTTRSNWHDVIESVDAFCVELRNRMDSHSVGT